jgi:hypothetical protein
LFANLKYLSKACYYLVLRIRYLRSRGGGAIVTSERDGDDEFLFPESRPRVVTDSTTPIATAMRVITNRYRRNELAGIEEAC